ncbi:MAG: hypothetical protein KKB38_20790 [Gammaproteobacteria bacterium]|nr:hypothetical protein [Gammaproteobacteria bacterium]
MFVRSTFGNFESARQPKAFAAVKGYLTKARSIILASPRVYGVGKTHLVSALINELIDTKQAVYMRSDGEFSHYSCPAYFTTETELLARIRNTYNHEEGEEHETEAHVFRFLSQFPLLVIDDVGKVRPRDLSFLQGVYFRIIDDRYSQGYGSDDYELNVILTTNLTLDALDAHIGGASADRLREMCGKENIITMTGKSYRGSK